MESCDEVEDRVVVTGAVGPEEAVVGSTSTVERRREAAGRAFPCKQGALRR